MVLSLIDPDQISAEIAERNDLASKITTHQAAPTRLPSWLKSYWPAAVLTAIATPICGLACWGILNYCAYPWHGVNWFDRIAFAFYSIMGAGTPVALGWVYRKERHEKRFLIGSHAEAGERYKLESGTLLDSIKAFNAAVHTLESRADIPAELRERVEARLVLRREELLADHARLDAEFDASFAPCVAELEARGLYSRAKVLETRNQEQFLALAEAVDDRPLKTALLDLEPTTPALLELRDPLASTEDIYAKLERLHGHEIPR